MQMNKNDVAWMKAHSAYVKGDTAEKAPAKAMENGYQPGTEPYNAFIDGFLDLVLAEASPAH